MRPRLTLGWSCLAGHVHTTELEAQMCIDAHVDETRRDPFEAIAGAVVPAGEQRVLKLVRRYIVHHAGELQPDGAQACRDCGYSLLLAAPPTANRSLWGFAPGRQVVQGPTCTYLVSPGRALAPDEVPCV